MIKSILLSLLLLLGSVQITYAQLNVQITGGDLTICKNETVNLNANIVFGSPTSFSWTSTVATFSNPTSGSTQATISDSGTVIFTASDGSTSFSDTIQVYAKPLPEIKLGTDESVCCDAGQLALNFKIEEPKGVPSTGKWSCTEHSSLVKNNQFDVDSACLEIHHPMSSKRFQAIYTYQDPTTLCEDSDSIEITVNKLSSLILQEADVCQNAGSIRIDDEVVISPSNTALGTPSWRCIECNGNDFENDMLEDRGIGAFSDFWLNVNSPNYIVKNSDKDTITLEFTYVNKFGCRTTDIVDIRIWRVPEIEFSYNRDLCFDEGEIALDSLTGVNVSDGVWTCYDSIGFESCTNLGGVNNDTINTYNSIDDDANHTWMLRYAHYATGCFTEKFIPITVNPLPAINIEDIHLDNQFCETDAAITLGVTPTGGDWSNPEDPNSIVSNSKYSPSSAQVFDQYTTLIYNYTSPITGCANVDSFRARTDKAPAISPIDDSAFCRQQGQTSIDLVYNLEAANSNNISWFAINPRASVSRYSATEDEVLTLSLQNQVADTFRVIYFAEAFSPNCNSVDDFFDVIVHPIPDASILKETPNGCKPLTTDLGVKINNQVSLSTSTYDWDFGDDGSDTVQTPSATFTSDGMKKFSVKITSEHGCDTTLNSSVDVYPIPYAEFSLAPNNNAPLSNPTFTFNNTSSCRSDFGSAISSSFWSFGDPDNSTSDLTSPMFTFPEEKATYQVVLQATTNYGCTDSYSYPVHVGKPGAVNVNEVERTNDIQIYPNPNKGVFTVVTNPTFGIEITNFVGQAIPFDRFGQSIRVDYKGLIFIRLTDKDENYSMTHKVYLD